MKFNIFLLVIDSFRSDKCFGKNKTAITPNIDNLIKNGVYFSQAISSASATIPSLVSLFTGVYPYKSSIRKVGDDHFSMNPDIRNLLEKLQNDGYELHAIVPDHFLILGLTKKFGKNVETYVRIQSVYDGIENQILEFKNSKQKKPWFLYTHLVDLHGSAKFVIDIIPKEYNDKKFGKNRYERMLSCLDICLEKIFRNIDFDNTLLIVTADHGSEDASYNKDIEEKKKETRLVEPNIVHKIASKTGNKAPGFLKPLKSMLRKKNLENRKRVVNSRQQKEITKINKMDISPFERRILLHSIKPETHLYDERFRIPLIFCGSTIKSKIIKDQVRMVDIFPTILELMGIKMAENEIHGRSLLPLLEGKDMEEVPALIDTAGNWNRTASSNCLGIRTSKFKYYRDKDDKNKKVHLFDLSNDPLEEKNIASENIALVENFEKDISKIINKQIIMKEKDLIRQKIAKKHKKLFLQKN